MTSVPSLSAAMGKGSSQDQQPSGSALHAVGSRVWLWSGDWLRGEVVAMEGPKLRVRLEDGQERDCNASDIPLQNSSAAGVEVRSRPGQWPPSSSSTWVLPV